MNTDIKIVENDRQLLADFIQLNEAWITRYFKIEEVDRELAKNPNKIIDDGGYVFSLVYKGEVLGVCALFRNEGQVFELARMAVSTTHQGRGLGSLLLRTALKKCRAVGARSVFLISNTKLESAIHLYKKHGFLTESKGEHPAYARANIVMRLKLDGRQSLRL